MYKFWQSKSYLRLIAKMGLLQVSKKRFLPFLLFGVLLLQLAFEANGQTFKELESLKPNQRRALAEFKRQVTPILSHDWMKEDIYLYKFMAFNLFKIPKSVEHLKVMLKWRKDNNVDEEFRISPNGPSKNYADMQKDYPVYCDGYDKEGRPIFELPFGGWDIRRAAAAGKTKRLIQHFLINGAERAEAKIREQQAKGLNVTKWIALANMEGFSVATHLCPACIPVSVSIAAGYDKYFPESPHGFWLLNTPDAFNILLPLVRPVMSPPTRTAIKSFSSNEKEWKPFLEKRVDLSEISTWWSERTTILSSIHKHDKFISRSILCMTL